MDGHERWVRLDSLGLFPTPHGRFVPLQFLRGRVLHRVEEAKAIGDIFDDFAQKCPAVNQRKVLKGLRDRSKSITNLIFQQIQWANFNFSSIYHFFILFFLFFPTPNLIRARCKFFFFFLIRVDSRFGRSL